MAGMIQILTYMFAFYLVVKGVEILLAALATQRRGLVAVAALTLLCCVAAAIGFCFIQDRQAMSLGQHLLRPAVGDPALDAAQAAAEAAQAAAEAQAAADAASSPADQAAVDAAVAAAEAAAAAAENTEHDQ